MYKIKYTRHFAKQFKKLSKHFQCNVKDFDIFLKNISLSNKNSIGRKCYKVRYSPKNYSKGKSSASRVIVLLITKNNILVPITIYEKSKIDNITKKELFFHVNKVDLELTK